MPLSVFHSLRDRSIKVVAALALTAVHAAAYADPMRLMTVSDLKRLSERGKGGEIAATAYVQGAVEAYLNMDAIVSNGNPANAMFCDFTAAYKAGVEHPAKLAPAMIAKWEAEQMGMEKPAMQMVRMYLMVKFGSRCAGAK
jgi:hypothetical protein